MLQPISQSEQALRDTLITQAEGYAFDDLQTLFGFERPSSINRDVWRQALRIVAYGHRGTLGCTWGMFELGLRSNPESRTILGALNPSNPHEFLGYGPNDPNILKWDGFSCQWIGRFVRMRYSLLNETGELQYFSKILYTVAPGAIPDEPPFPETIFFCDVETGLWTTEAVDNPLWTIVDGGGAPINNDVEVTIELLPFDYREPLRGPLYEEPSAGLPVDPLTGKTTQLEFLRGFGETCLIEVLVDEQAFFVPASYLLDPAGVDRPANFPGQPYGSHLMDVFGAVNGESTPDPPEGTGAPIVEIGDPLGEGPHPIYLIDAKALAGLATFFDPILAAGVHLETRLRDFCLFENTNVGPDGAILFWDNFIPEELGGQGFDDDVPGGASPQARWTYNYLGFAPDPYTVLRILLDGRYVALFLGGIAGHPVAPGGERWLSPNREFETPIRVQYEFTHGDYGVPLEAPDNAQNEYLYLQYSTDGGASWINLVQHEFSIATEGVWSNSTVEIDSAVVPDGTDIRVRWAQDSYDNPGDNWAIATVLITRP